MLTVDAIFWCILWCVLPYGVRNVIEIIFVYYRPGIIVCRVFCCAVSGRLVVLLFTNWFTDCNCRRDWGGAVSGQVMRRPLGHLAAAYRRCIPAAHWLRPVPDGLRPVLLICSIRPIRVETGPRPRTRKRKVASILVVLSLVDAISGYRYSCYNQTSFLKLKYTRPLWEACSAPPDPLAGFRGLLLRGKREENGKGKRGRTGPKVRGSGGRRGST